MQDSLIGLPDLASDPEIVARKETLIEEAKKSLHALEYLGETLRNSQPLYITSSFDGDCSSGTLGCTSIEGFSNC